MPISSAVHRTYSFGEFTLDLDRGALLKAGADIKLRPKSFEMLSYLVERHGLLVSKYELLNAIWGHTVVTEDAITHCVTDIRRALDDRSQDMLRTVPRRGYIFDLPVTASDVSSPAILASRWPRWGLITALILVLGIAATVLMFAWDKWWTAPPPERSVAVLPFTNMSTDEETGHLGTGIAETILTMLAQMPELRVASASSSFQSRLEGLSVPEIAGLLGVATVLEGSVQRQGNRLRVTAQLIDAENNAHLWSRNFDRDDTDIFEVQDEIAAAVTSALRIVMREEVRQRIDRESTDNVAAFEAYSRAIDSLRVLTTESFGRALKQLQRAVELDPDFARAYAMLGYAYLNEYCCPGAELTRAERRDLAREAAKTALQIAPGLSTALTVLGRVTDDIDAEGELYREAVANDSNDTIALRVYATYLFKRYQTDEATELARKLIRLDPIDEKHYILLARQQRQQSMIREALETLARGKEKIPKSGALRDQEDWCYSALGDYSSMIRVKHETLAIDPEDFINRWVIAQDYLHVGMPEEAARWGERAVETAPEREQDFLRLMLRTTLDVYYQRNDEEVFDSLRRWVTERGGWSFAGNNLAHYIFTEYGGRLGRLDDVLSTYESLFPHLFTDPPDLEKYVMWTSIVGEALLLAGDRQRSEPLLNSVLESINRHADSGRDIRGHVITLLYLGDTDTALNEFRQLNGARKFWHGGLGQRFVMENSPVWTPIRAAPEYAALLEELDGNAAEHRRFLQAMDLPVK